MAIHTSDLEYIESMAGYGAKASVFRTDLGMCIEIGKVYDDIGWFGGRLHLTDEDVDNLDKDKSEIVKFAEDAANRFNAKLGGKFLK